MRYFVTGATGWIGSATTAELVGAGHEVRGLVRTDEAARRLESLGGIPWRGDLADPEGLARAADESDGVVHLAFAHDVAWHGDFVSAATTDRRAVEAMGTALAGSGRPLILASGVAGLDHGRPATESDGLVPSAVTRALPVGRRAATALYVLSLRGVDVRSCVLRFPPTVHGAGDHGFVAWIAGAAHRAGSSAYVGDGTNAWSAVHVVDAARLVRRALEDAPAGSVLHAVAEEGVPFREIAAAIGRSLGVPTQSISPEEALSRFDHLGPFVAMDARASAAVTSELLGWAPRESTLIEDVDAGHYRPESL